MWELDYQRVEPLDESDYSLVKSCLLMYLGQEFAAKRKVCNYSDISNYLKAQFNLNSEPNSRGLARLLEDISKSEHTIGDPMLSVVVVNKETKMPGDGFFKLAKELNLYKGSLKNKKQMDEFFIQELRRVHDLWVRECDPEWSEYLRLKKKFEGR